MNSCVVPNDHRSTRIIDAFSEIQTISGSQRVGKWFSESAQTAYANLVYHPVALFLLCLSVLILVAKTHATNGPFE